MKRVTITALALLCTILTIRADLFTHTFTFTPEKFAIDAGGGDSLRIRSIAAPTTHPDPSQPDLPILARSIAIPDHAGVVSYSVKSHKHIIRSGVDIENASLPISSIRTKNAGYPAGVYPDSVCVLTKTYRIGDIEIAGFLLSPFEYDATARELYFIDSITVDLELGEPKMLRSSSATTPAQLSVARAMVDNCEMLDNVYTAETSATEEHYDYLVVCNSDIVESGALILLVDWKYKKGVKPFCITIDDINNAFPGATLQERIRRGILEIHSTLGIQSVLLAGDASIIPPKYYTIPSIGTVPTDLYYACSGDLDWDSEEADVMNMVPDIDVTRIPVRTPAEFADFVNRIMNYEREPVFTATMLQAGGIYESAAVDSVQVNIHGKVLINASSTAKQMYDEIINNKIYFAADEFFGANIIPGIQTFKDELEKGYPFAEIIAGGYTDKWTYLRGLRLEETELFGMNEANTLDNVGYTIISTPSSFTNAFDNADGCLSTALMLNPNSGIIGYVGSTGQSFVTPGTLDYSMAFEAAFYDRMLDKTIRPYKKSLGAVMTHLRHSLLILADNDDYYKYLYLAVNALGDPETPIYVSTPLNLNNASVTVDADGIDITTGFSDAKVCVSGDGYYNIVDGDKIHLSLNPGTYNVLITRNGYIPKYFSCVVARSKTTNAIESAAETDLNAVSLISVYPSPTYDNTMVKYTSGGAMVNLQLMLSNLDGTQVYKFALDPKLSEGKIDLSQIPAGMYVAVLLVDGVPTSDTSLRLMK
ncbi:MAG: hypothetical protein K2K79_08210 [Paramuribaculum sp.]|nr:hypothetical protein [Paramuribaculum sp.]